MKIAVITYHYSSNNGATMQTYGLCRFLKEQGHDVCIIDIRQDENWNVPAHIRIAKFLIQERRIEKFIKKHFPPLTRRYHSIEDLRNDPPKVDCYIVGSDQTWNPDISKELYLAYFLDFGDENTRRLSYASSFGVKEWSFNNKSATEHIQACLEKFAVLSVREQDGADLCERTFHLRPIVVLDPSFLNDRYDELTGKIKEKNQIVCYKLNKTKDFFENVHYVKEKLGLPAVLLNENYPKKGLKYCFNPGVSKWLRAIGGAKFVITDSFHGAVFSIMFKRQFIVTLNRDSKDSRLVNLMRSMGLENYLVDNLVDLKYSEKWLKPIDYKKVEEKKKILVRESRNYLIDALK